MFPAAYPCDHSKFSWWPQLSYYLFHSAHFHSQIISLSFYTLPLCLSYTNSQRESKDLGWASGMIGIGRLDRYTLMRLIWRWSLSAGAKPSWWELEVSGATEKLEVSIFWELFRPGGGLTVGSPRWVICAGDTCDLSLVKAAVDTKTTSSNHTADTTQSILYPTTSSLN